MAVVAAPGAFGQITAHTGAAATTVYTSPSGGGEGLALDSSGNVFTGFNSAIGIFKSTYSNGSYATASIGVVADYFYGLAFDSSGNLYAADESNGNIDKISYSGGSYTLTTLFTVPGGTTAGVAVDGYGNIYTNNYSTTLYKYTLSGGVYTPHPIVANFSQTRNLAVDANGVIYQADGSANKVRVFAPVGAVATTATYTEKTAFACGASCAGVAVTGNGTVYIGANATLYQETPNGSGGYVQSTVSNAFSQIRGMGVDLSGNIFVGDLGTFKVTKLTTALPDFGTVTVGTTSAQQPITFVIDTNTGGTALGTPKFLTQGIAGQDFAAGTGSTCTGVLAAGSTCTVYTTFAPQAAGLRTGAVQLTDASGNVLATAFVRGVGNAGQVAFLAPKGTVLPGVPAAPRAITVDGAGNIYDPNSTPTLYKVTPAGVSAALYTSANSSSLFAAAAVDGAGNVYIVDRGTDNLVEVSASGTLLRTIALGASAGGGLGQVALDASATAYVADAADGKIIEVNQAGTITSLPVAGYSSGSGVAVDRNGTVYVTLASTNQIAEITNGVQTNVTPTGAALNGPNSLTVDAAGDLWVTNGSNGIVFITPAGVGTKLNLTGFSAGFIYGIALDGKGNLYFPDQFAASVNVLNLSTNQALSFPTTAIGSSSVPQSVALANVGTQNLSFPAPGAGTNPSLSAGFSLSNSSTCPQVSSGSAAGALAAGTTCTGLVSFAPAMVGSYAGSLVITDNNLNASPSTTQSVAVSGTGAQGPVAVTVAAVSGLPGSAVSLTATISYGGVAPTGTVTMSVGAFAVSPLTCTTSSYTKTCTGNYNTGALPAGNYTVSANITADSNYTAGSGTGTLTLVPASFAAPGTAVSTSSATQTATLVFSSATTLNATSATAIQVVTQGVAGKDFLAVTGGTCTQGTSYSVGASCTVQYTFKPTAPGVRLGAVLLYDGSSNMVASTYLSGIGQGPLVNFEGNSPVTLAGASGPASIAIDPAGNVFYAQNIAAGHVIELNSSGTQIASSGQYYGPVGVTIDGVGNVYTYSSGGCCSNTLTKYPNGNLANPQSFSINTGGQIDGSLAVDGAGDIYLPSSNGSISGFIKLTPQGSGYAESTLLTNKSVLSLGLDSAGNVYAATVDNQLYMVTPSGVSTLIASTGLNFPQGVAVDAAGNIYVGNNHGQNVVRFAAGTYAQTVVVSGFGTYALALDAVGNLYIGDTTNNRIAKITRTAMPAQRFGSTPVGATSAADVIKLENNGNTALSFAGFGSSSASFLVDSTTTTCSTSSTLPPSGVCAVGTKYAPQSINSTSGLLTLTDNNLNASGSTQTGTLTGIASPGVEVITTNSLSAVSGSAATLNAVISYGGVQPVGPVTFKIGSGATVVAICTAGAGVETCTASYATAGLPVGNNTITTTIGADLSYLGATVSTATLNVVPGSYVAPTTAVSSASATQTATLVLSQAGTVSSVSALTQGSANLDYKVIGFTCSGSTVGSTCTVQYTFTPTVPGARNGGLLLLASNGSVLGSSYLTGTGTGPQAVVYPGTQTALVSGLVGDAFGIAIDGNKNLYVARGPGYLYKETYSGGTYTQTNLGSGLNNPSGVAVDGLGNVYIADTNNNRIAEEVNSPGGYAQTFPFTGLNGPFAVAVDGAGNVYIGNGGQLLKETYSGGNYTSTTLDSGLGNIISLAVDGSGNLYVADAGTSALYKETYSGGSYARSTIATGLGNVNGVVVDAAGTVYAVADGTSTHVLRYAPNGSGGYLAVQTVGTFVRSNGIAIDNAGNLYVTDDRANNSVYEINVSSAASYVFGTTSVGSITGANTVNVNNIGNAALTISALGTSSANFSIVAASTTCSTSTPLAAAGSCVLSFTSTPQTSGASTGTVMVTDNNLNVSGSTQLENVSGSATAGVVTFAVGNATVQAGSPVVLSAVISYGGAQATGNVTFQVGSGATVTATCVASAGSETCTASYPTAGLSMGSNTITAAISADSNYAGLTSSAAVLNVVPGSFAAPSTAVGSGSATQTATLVFGANTTLNANLATAIQVVTQGATGLDFGYVAGGTNACAAGATYTAGQTCTVQYSFNPLAPGVRVGGILLKSNDATPLTVASTYLSGTGTGPQAVFTTGVVSTFATNVSSQNGFAVDAAGDLYFTEPDTGTIQKVAAGTSTPVTVLTGLNEPSGIAIDGLGNIYYAQYFANSVSELVGGTGTPVTVASIGNPEQIALDAAGNLYVASAAANVVQKYTAGSFGASTTYGTGLSHAIGVALDVTGNVYISGYFSGNIIRVTADGTTQTTVATGLTTPGGIAVDAAGDVYAGLVNGTSAEEFAAGTFAPTVLNATLSDAAFIIVDGSGNLYVSSRAANQIAKLTRTSGTPLTFANTAVGGIAAAQSETLTNIGNATLSISGLGTSSPNFTLDPNSTNCSTTATLASAASCSVGATFTPQMTGSPLTANFNVADNSLNVAGTTQAIALSGAASSGALSIAVATTTAALDSSVTLTATVGYAAVPPTGAVTFQVGSGAIVTATCTTSSAAETCTGVYPTTGLPAGNDTVTVNVAADANYNASSATGTLAVVPVSFAAPSTGVSSSSAVQTATLIFTTPGTLGSINVLTQGNPNLDFTLASGSGCVVGQTYQAGATCTVQYTFAPQAPGQRLGGITLLDGSGNLLTSAFLSGAGTGPVAVFPTASTKTTVASVAQPTGIARDAAGNLYVTDYNNGNVLKYVAVNGVVPANATAQTLASGLAAACGVTVDGVGNVFALSAGNNSITEIPFSGASYGTPVTIVSGESAPCGAAVDANGNVYFSNQSAGTVREILASAGAIPSNPTVITVAGGFSSPQGEAVDVNGNVYVVSTGNNLLYQVPFTNGSFGTPVSVPVGTSGFFGITMDGSGNLYLGVMGNTPILEVQAVNGTIPMTNPSIVSLGSGFGGPRSIAVDGAGNLFVADFDNQAISRLDLTSSPVLTFANTAVGSTSAAQSTPVLNNGNASLAIAGLAATSLNFSVDATSTTCSASTALVAGATCNVGATFRPSVGGVQTASVNITDNNLNATSAVQAVSLAGTGDAGSSSVAVGSVSVVYGTASAALSATVNFLGSTVPTGAFSFTVGTGTTLAANCTGSASPLTCTATYPLTTLAAGSYTITGTLTADANVGTASATGTLTVTQATAALSILSSSASFSNASTTLTAMLTYPGSLPPTGAVTFQVGSGPLVTAACAGTSSPLSCTATYPLAAAALGSNGINVSLAADTNYTAATATGTLTVTAASATITVSNVTALYSASTTTLTASVAYTGNTRPVGPVTFAVGSGAAVTATCSGSASPLTCTASYNTASLTPKSYTITGTLPADAHFGVTTATGTLTITPATAAVTVASQSISYGTASTSLSATVAYTGAVPAGAVTFAVDNGAAVAATCSGSSSPLTCTAIYPTANLSTGAHTVKVSAAADTNYGASTGTGTFTVGQATATLTVASQSGSYGVASTSLSASIAYSGPAAPTGAVSFIVDNGAAVVATCSGTGSPLTCSAVYATASLTAGAHTIAVTAAADVNYKAAAGSGSLTIAVTSANISFTVGNHAYGDTAVTLAATSNSTGAFTYSVVSGPATVSGTTLTITGVGPIVLQASQAADPNFSASSKQASFTIAQAALTAAANNVSRTYGAANPNFSGSVSGAKYSDTFTETFSTTANTASAVGTYAIVPAVTGTDLADYNTTLTNGTLTITQAATTTNLTASAASLNPGQNLTLTASVLSSTTGTPTGSATFFDNGTALTTVALVNGTAVFSTSTLAPGTTHSLTLSYAGDTNFLPSATTLGSSVVVGALDFTFNTTGATAYTAAPGTVATFNFALSPNFGSYAGAVNFTVTGLPAGATYSFSPSTIAATGGAQPVVLSVQTPKATAKNGSAPLSPMQRGAPALALLLLPGLCFGRVRRKLGARMLTLILLVAGLGGAGLLTGCGASNGFQLQPESTYTLTVTATSGSLQHTQTVTLTVQ